ncbi:MAG: cytidine deaminase [Acidobacteria bacterium]|nr:cytidine deaminase [Acidobacteriota bacterium]
MATAPIVEALSLPQPELFFGLVAPTGIDLEAFQNLACDLLQQYSYSTKVARLSDLARRAAVTTVDDSSHFSRVTTLQNAGNELRRNTQRGDVLALHAIFQISNAREVIAKDAGAHRQPLPGVAHVFRSLKHPEEVETLRRVYGAGFFLIGVYASEEDRYRYLRRRLGMSAEDARLVLQRDEDEPKDPFGQHTRDTFRMADVFVREGDEEQLVRFFDLVFGAPFVTPTLDEYAMFFAFASALRSAQYGRQVGAVVVSREGEIIGVGANDVPKFGGGLYWPGPKEKDRRDHNYYPDGADSNEKEIARIIDDAIERLAPFLQTQVDRDAIHEALAGSRLDDLTEFGRAVHAEMEALLACARTGVSVKGGTVYTTTFPCHNCARHIVASGIAELQYVEPYPKSRALRLHNDSIALDQHSYESRVRFRPFLGVSARRYFDLFSMKLSGGVPLIRKKHGRAVEWTRETANPRVRLSHWSYIQREVEAAGQLAGTITASRRHNPDPGSEEHRK